MVITVQALVTGSYLSVLSTVVMNKSPGSPGHYGRLAMPLQLHTVYPFYRSIAILTKVTVHVCHNTHLSPFMVLRVI